MDTSRISPTAHYTGTIWARHGLSHPALSAALSPTLYHLARPLMAVTSPLLGGMTLEKALLQRHLLVEAVLCEAVERRGVRQVVEIAAGMSARGLRLSERYADLGLTYVEGDLPDMVARKRGALEGLRGPRHHVLPLNALVDEGPTSLRGATADLLDPSLPTAVITEGLLLYFDRAQVEGLWGRIGSFLAGFPQGMYAFDLISADVLTRFPAVALFFRLLTLVARGRVVTHYATPAEASAQLHASGFESVVLHEASAWSDRLPLPNGSRGELQRVGEVWTRAG